MSRTIIAELWTGAVVVRPIGLSAAEQALRATTLSDAEVSASLGRLGVVVPDTEAERRATLAGWPSLADLDAIATAMTASNDGVRPVVRVLEMATVPGRSRGKPGQVPR
ncbi:MAG: hypothetical protein WKF96_12280 [Solirubrobacteraceae bacterium]